MAGNFLQRSRHGTTYFFRRRVPDDVQHIVGKRQLYTTLSTSDRREALLRARAFAVETDHVFQELRAMKRKKGGGQIGLTLTLELDAAGKPRIQLQTEPHDTAEDKERGFSALKEAANTLFGGAAASADGSPAPASGKTLQEAVAEYLKGIKKPKTFRAYRTALCVRAIPHFGADTPISSIDQERFAAYVADVFADTRRSHGTKEGYVNAFTSLFSWLRARYPRSTPALTTRKLIPTRDNPEAEERDRFTMDQLRVIFENASRFRDAEPHKFWVTVVTAFMGCRIEELAQVNLETDLHQHEGSDLWYFDLNELPDPDGVKRKSLKRPRSSKRVAPIHSALVRHGFVTYLRNQQKQGATRPFELGWKPWKEPERGGVHWAHYIIRWGGRELEKLDKSGKLTRAGLKLGYFHSMRHTLAQVLAERGVSEEPRAALQGQAVPGAGENATRYVNLRQDPKLLSALVEQHLTDYAAMLDDVLAGAKGNSSLPARPSAP